MVFVVLVTVLFCAVFTANKSYILLTLNTLELCLVSLRAEYMLWQMRFHIKASLKEGEVGTMWNESIHTSTTVFTVFTVNYSKQYLL